MGIDLDVILSSPNTTLGGSASSEKIAPKTGLRVKQPSVKMRVRFYEQLQLLLDAGLNIRQVVQLIIDEKTFGENSMHKTMERIYQDISDHGLTLSQAMLNTQKFSAFETYLIETGEKTGQLSKIAESLLQHFKSKLDQKKMLTGLLAYPLILVLSTLALLFGMIKFVIPVFARLLEGFNTELPALTQGIIRFSGWIGKLIPVFIIVVLILLVLHNLLKGVRLVRSMESNLLLNIPFIGKLLKLQLMEKFARSLSILLNANLDVSASLEQIKKSIDDYAIERTMDQIIEQIKNGKQLSTTMREFKIYDKRMVSLIKLSEEVGKVGPMLEKVANQYKHEIESKTKLMASVLQPMLLIIVGTLITIIGLGLFMPIFQLSNGI